MSDNNDKQEEHDENGSKEHYKSMSKDSSCSYLYELQTHFI